MGLPRKRGAWDGFASVENWWKFFCLGSHTHAADQDVATFDTLHKSQLPQITF